MTLTSSDTCTGSSLATVAAGKTPTASATPTDVLSSTATAGNTPTASATPTGVASSTTTGGKTPTASATCALSSEPTAAAGWTATASATAIGSSTSTGVVTSAPATCASTASATQASAAHRASARTLELRSRRSPRIRFPRASFALREAVLDGDQDLLAADDIDRRRQRALREAAEAVVVTRVGRRRRGRALDGRRLHLGDRRVLRRREVRLQHELAVVRTARRRRDDNRVRLRDRSGNPFVDPTEVGAVRAAHRGQDENHPLSHALLTREQLHEFLGAARELVVEAHRLHEPAVIFHLHDPRAVDLDRVCVAARTGHRCVRRAKCTRDRCDRNGADGDDGKRCDACQRLRPHSPPFP